MKDRRAEKSDGFDHRLREWSGTEPGISDSQFRRALLDRLPEIRPRSRVPLGLATAASLAVLLIGLQSTWRPPSRDVVDVPEPEVVYETGDNVILVLRDGGPPIYVLTDREGTNGATP